MIKMAGISLLFALINTQIFSQETHFGIKGGMNVSDVVSRSGNNLDNKIGLHVGGLAHIHFSKQFAVQPELLYSTEGAKNADTKFNFSYINIPVMFQYMFDKGFRLQTGPQMGILTVAKNKTGSIEQNVTKDLSSVNFSWSFGAGFLFPEGVGVDARYNLGLSNISAIDGYRAQTRTFQLGIFYQFMKQHPKRKR